MRESKFMEFKEDITNTFLKTVSAYSNYYGGKIKFGISDNGEILGVQDPRNASLNIENKINDSISPKPDFNLEIDENDVITLTVIEGPHKPYFYRSKAYKRNETSTVEVDTLELTRLILEGKNKSFEEIQSKKQNLTFKELEDNFIKHLGINKITRDILVTLELYSEEDTYNNAAQILADENDFSGVDIVRFGDSINIILDREILEGVSILRLYDESMVIYKRYYQYEEIRGALRKTIKTIPEEAFKEAMANALIHRTWDSNSHIQVGMYEDRVEVVYPGGLPKGISKEEYLNGQISILRNPIIGNIFFRLHRIERFGTGIKRIKGAYLKSQSKPQFEIYDNSIKVILPTLAKKLDLNPDDKLVYQSLSKHRILSSSEIVKITGFGKTKVIKSLNSLSNQGHIEIIGSGRSTKYKIS